MADNVIKLKPPMAFSLRDADAVVEALDAVMGELAAGDAA